MFSFPRLKLKFLVKVDLRRSECPVTAMRSELSLSTELLIGDDKLICHIKRFYKTRWLWESWHVGCHGKILMTLSYNVPSHVARVTNI